MLRHHSQYDSRLGFSFGVLVRVRVGFWVRVDFRVRVNLTKTLKLNPNLLSYWECCRNIHTMMTRTKKPDVSETDVSSKKMKIQQKKTGSPEVTRVAVMPSQNVSSFQKRWVAVLQGEQSISSTKSCRPIYGCYIVS